MHYGRAVIDSSISHLAISCGRKKPIKSFVLVCYDNHNSYRMINEQCYWISSCIEKTGRKEFVLHAHGSSVEICFQFNKWITKLIAEKKKKVKE